MNHIIPAILAKDESDFRSRFTALDDAADMIQLDVLDNTLYPNVSWCDMDILDGLDTSAWVELHLMVDDPGSYLERIKEGGPIHRVLWHVEVAVDHADLFLTCQSKGIECGLAIAPKTPIEALRPFAELVDEVLILGVEPGFAGQTILPETIQKARDIHAHWPGTVIGFDGGVNAQTLPQLRDAGVTRFCAASAIWKDSDPKAAFDALRSA